MRLTICVVVLTATAVLAFNFAPDPRFGGEHVGLAFIALALWAFTPRPKRNAS